MTDADYGIIDQGRATSRDRDRKDLHLIRPLTMASFLRSRLGPQLARTATRRWAAPIAQRTMASAASPPGTKHGLEYHTVEDLHSMDLKAVLGETGTSKDATMRHFTGELIIFVRCNFVNSI